ncbi:MAG TPA: M15 family metallopeptidase [Myxococcales bacterium]|jgi:peptidoglycan hydrolase-like protein with peptidoglycan-binding domain
MTVSSVRSGSSARSSSSSYPVLRQGAHGSSVTQMQNLLRKKGYQVAADGDFGPKTAQALKSFQSAHHLGVDGVVGPKTWAALRGAGGSSGTGSTGSSGASSGPGKTVVGYQSGHKTSVKVSYVGQGEWMNTKCAGAYKNMLAAARKAGVNLGTTDGYRTYAEQASLYRRYGSGRAARPGYSNHQMGLSADIAGVGGYNTRAYRWLRNNAGRFGFSNDVRGEYWHWTYRH